MDDLLAYRDRFPILRRLHVSDQPLARGDARCRGGPAARVRAHVARARHPRVGRGLVGHVRDGRRPARADHGRAARQHRHAPERDRRGDGRPLVLPQSGRTQPHRLRGGELPVGALPLPGAAGARGGRRRGRPGDRRRDRRANAARPDQPRPVQERGDPGRRADRRARARGGRVRRARLLPVGRRRPVRPDGARRRLRVRRQRQVAVRRAGRRLAVRASRSGRAARADVRRLAGTRAAVRVRAGAGVRARARGASSRARRTSPRSTRRRRATT